jgi:hypothetical protein
MFTGLYAKRARGAALDVRVGARTKTLTCPSLPEDSFTPLLMSKINQIKPVGQRWRRQPIEDEPAVCPVPGI